MRGGWTWHRIMSGDRLDINGLSLLISLVYQTVDLCQVFQYFLG
jgi:hypothetical protein